MPREAALDGNRPQRIVRPPIGSFECHPAIVAAIQSGASGERAALAKRAARGRRELQPFLCCDERLIASLISLIDLSISASSSSSGETSVPSTLAWIVDAKTASPSEVV
jgi:hypothetical protein